MTDAWKLTSKIWGIKFTYTRVSRGEWLGNAANFKRPAYCFDFDVERRSHVPSTNSAYTLVLEEGGQRNTGQAHVVEDLNDLSGRTSS